MSNVSKTLYIGVTNNLERMVFQHRMQETDGFAKQYNTTMPIFMEEFPDPTSAIAREKQLKNWNRAKKLWLVERQNPEWRDLAKDWFGPSDSQD